MPNTEGIFQHHILRLAYVAMVDAQGEHKGYI
jgi:hypothetical protein